MSVLADTHALHWFLAAPERLGAAALERLHAAERDEADGVLVSVASRIDLHYLAASGRLDVELAKRVWAVTAVPDVNISAVAVTEGIAERFGDLALGSLRDPWDRLIVATAVELGVPLITADRAMAAVGLVDVIR